MNQSSDVFERTLREALERWEIPINPHQEFLLGGHYQAMVEANRSMNLTRITDPAEAACKHYADSLAFLLWNQSMEGEDGVSSMNMPTRARTCPVRLLDVGTGAGFPAVLLAVMRPDWQVVALDGTQKKVRFLAGYARDAGIDNLHVEHGHSDHWECEEKFDFVTTRAVADLGRVIRSCRRFLGRGGKIVAYKTAHLNEDENTGANQAAAELKLIMDEPFQYDLRCGEETLYRALYLVRVA